MDYDAYLDSLEMKAEIEPLKLLYLERVTQLINKTNQFNLTTRRYTQAEVYAILKDRSVIALYGRLSDRFGDNGLVSVVVGRCASSVLEIDLWLMSCRVLKREMEHAMLDALAANAREAGMRTLRGIYLPTAKNAMVAEHYVKLGFKKVSELPSGEATYELDLHHYTRRNRHIRVLQMALVGD